MMSTQIDVQEVLTLAYEIADLIKQSEETKHYLKFKEQLNNDHHAITLLNEFQQKKAFFADCERYGHFHPDYHRAFDEVVAVQDRLNQLEIMRQLHHAEHKLDELLYDVSKRIAASVSDTIIVPNNFELNDGGSGCSSGQCSGKCS
jgi:cell fate (sporulation/competence/biofilm development) regulator YlbF (YheA/YmcA/DUF963 family)